MPAATSSLPVPASTPGTASPWPVFAIASTAAFLVSLDATMLYAAFGALRAGFPGTGADALSWVLNAYTVVYAAMLIPAGGLADAWGRPRVFLAGVALFTLASLACGLAPSVPLLVAARIVQAIGAALLTPASLSIVMTAFPPQRRALVISAWGAVAGFAAAVGPSLGAFLASHAGWPWAFFINLPIGVLTLWRGAALLRGPQPALARARIDGIGMLLLIVAVGAAALAIVESEAPSWSRGELLSVGGLAAAALGGFVAWARHAEAPLVDLALFRHGAYGIVNLATLAFGTAFALTFFAFFFYMGELWHYDAARAGIAIAPGPLLVIPVAIVTGRLAGRLGHRPFLVGGALLYALAGLWFLHVPGLEPHYLTHWLPGLVMNGIAVGLVLPSLSGAAVSRLPPAQYAVGSAINQATRQIGAVIGVAIAVLLLSHGPLQRAHFDAVYGLQIGLALLTALLCAGVRTAPGARR